MYISSSPSLRANCHNHATPARKTTIAAQQKRNNGRDNGNTWFNQEENRNSIMWKKLRRWLCIVLLQESFCFSLSFPLRTGRSQRTQCKSALERDRHHLWKNFSLADAYNLQYYKTILLTTGVHIHEGRYMQYIRMQNKQMIICENISGSAGDPHWLQPRSIYVVF